MRLASMATTFTERTIRRASSSLASCPTTSHRPALVPPSRFRERDLDLGSRLEVTLYGLSHSLASD
jgi:hypothetical protein